MLGYVIVAYLILAFIRFHVGIAREQTHLKEKHCPLFSMHHALSGESPA